jgi:hypothetical protein
MQVGIRCAGILQRRCPLSAAVIPTLFTQSSAPPFPPFSTLLATLFNLFSPLPWAARMHSYQSVGRCPFPDPEATLRLSRGYPEANWGNGRGGWRRAPGRGDFWEQCGWSRVN